MARMPRLVAAGLPHHVVQRGVRSMDIFEDDADREAYLDFLAGAADSYGISGDFRGQFTYFAVDCGGPRG